MNGWEKQTLENCVVILENSAIVPAGGCVPSQSWRAICTLWVWGLRDALYTIIIVSLYVCVCACAKSLQSCLTLCDLVDCSPPFSSVHGILQARILEWVAMLSSRGSSQPRDRTWVSYVPCTDWQAGSLPLAPPGKARPPFSLSLYIYIEQLNNICMLF